MKHRRIACWARSALAIVLLTLMLVPVTSAPATAASLFDRLAVSGSVTGGRAVTIKAYLTQPAPTGGVLIILQSSSPLVPVPPTMWVPPGETHHAIQVNTAPTSTTTPVTVTAGNGIGARSQVIVVKEPVLSSLSVQTVIRAGGNGKVTVRLSGIAPAGGIVVNVTSNRPSILPMPGPVTIPAGSAGKTLIIPATTVSSDVAVNVSAYYDGVKITKPTIVRNLS